MAINNDDDRNLMDSSRRDFLKKTAAAALVAAMPIGLTKYSHAAGAPLNIGCIASFSGYLSDQAQNVVQGVQLAADELNSKGGVLGRQVNVLVRDDEMKPPVGARRYLDLVKNDKIAMHSGLVSGSISAVIEQTNRSLGNDAIIQWNSSATQTQQAPAQMDPNLFFAGSSVEAYGMVGGEFGATIGKKCLVMYVDYSSGWQMRDGFLRSAAANGVQVVGQIAIPMSATDLQPFLTQVLSKSVDFICVCVNGMMLVNFMKQAYGMGLTKRMKFMTFQVNLEEINGCGPEVIQGTYIVADYFWNLQNPLNQHFVQKYMAKFGQNKRPSVRTFVHYSSVMMWADAVAQVKTIDTKTVAHKLAGFSADYGKGKMYIRPTGDHTCISPLIVARAKGPREMKDPLDTQEILKTYSGEKYFWSPKEKGY